ncbi:MAG TPA: GlsB/YeaQ/YmgE family stress response membrane protein [Ignavibacteria bacterium]|nr:GlsB/YeaQ/YmgE family stress response membrane protein [Ignavibacteria bacterium]
MFSLIWTAIIGVIVGGIAKLFMPGKDVGGFFVTMLIGIAGSFLASFLGSAVGWYKDGDTAGFITSILGAMLLLFIYRLIRGKGAAKAIKD